MNVSNHILAGSAIALTIRQPALALPLALVSHFALDALPHFGYDRRGYDEMFKNRLTYAAVLIDVIGVMFLAVTVVTHSWLVFFAAVFAVLPDSDWLYRYAWYERHGDMPPATTFSRLHVGIQWCERPWGLIVEVLFFVAGVLLVHKLLLQ